MGNIFLDLTLIICMAAGLSLIFRFFKQPEILAYILTGIIIASFQFFNSSNEDLLRSLSEVGITLLLFMVGLEIRISELLSMGKVLILASISQIIGTFVIGFLLSAFFGFDIITSFYVAIALTFSSTIVVVKLLSDQMELHSLHAKFSLGILLVQDLLAIFILMFLSGINNQGGGGMASLLYFGGIFIKAALLFAAVAYLSRNIFPKLVEHIGRSSETLFLVSLAWVFGLAAIVSSKYIGFSIEIGGFLAGVALANSMANYQIIAKAKILRDFFIIIFFVLLGIQMSFANIPQIIVPAIILSLFVLIIKPLIVMVTLSVLGYRKRTSFLTGVSLSQVSEFSLIVAFIGLRLGHIDERIVSLITLVGLISFATSTYMISHWKTIYKKISSKIDFIQRENLIKEEIQDITGFEHLKGHVVVVGGDQMGQSIVEALEDMDKDVVVVDFDPIIVKNMESSKVHKLFGDIADLDIQQRAKIDEAKLVISTIPDIGDNLLLLKELKHENRRAKIVMMALDGKDAKTLYKGGADYVILPHLAGGRQIAKLITDDALDKIDKLKEKDKNYLA